MKPTKKYIADKALLLFNEKGFVNIRLQHIADAAFISVGHLAYHFKNKKAIIEFLYDELRKEQEMLLNEFRVVPLFEDIQLWFNRMYQLQQRYIFFYLDTLELLRYSPEIKEKHQQHLAWKLQQINHMFDFNLARGAFTENSKQYKTQIVWQLQLLTESWQNSSRATLQEEISAHIFLQQLWSILIPFFSDMGQREYEQLQHQV